MSRIVFLDFDGVLNSEAFLRSNPRLAEPISPDLVARVERICAITGARVVVSSAWRRSFKLPRLRRLLSQHGLGAKVVGVTPVIPGVQRGVEIQRWLDVRGADVTGLVILDDYADMAHLRPWLVQTSAAVGITDAEVERAVEIVGRPMPGRRVA